MKTTVVMVGAIVCALSVMACQGRPTRLSPEFGSSARLLVENQILNPNAPTSLDPVEGMDGKASLKILEQYHKSFEGKRKQTERAGFVINAGSSKK